MPNELTVTDAQGRGWSVRFLDQKEWTAFKRDAKFGANALRAEKLKKSWPDSAVFEGALAYFEGRVIHFQAKDREKWLARRGLKEIRL